MLVLGATSDDRGSQLETLIRTVLTGQGYVDVRRSFVAAGGNELDVVAKRLSQVMGETQVTPVVCEAKALADPISMTAWLKFLGKVFVERLENSNAVGILVTLNGINGNVAGSFEALRRRDTAIFVLDGTSLLASATQAGELSPEADVIETVSARFDRRPHQIEAAYYGGGYLWVVRWSGEEYSIVDGHGGLLPISTVEELRDALENSVTGRLVATTEAQALLEAKHAARITAFNKMFQGQAVDISQSGEFADTVAALGGETFCRLEGVQLRLLPANELSAPEIATLVRTIFAHPVRVQQLGFVARHLHEPYIRKLVEGLSELQGGFFLDEDSTSALQNIAPLFPSIWLLISSPLEMFAAHRGEEFEGNDDVLTADRNYFWEEISRVVRSDFTNVFLRGFLYDYLDVAELVETQALTVKTKSEVIGTATSSVRRAIGVLDGGLAGPDGTAHVLIQKLPSVGEPWDQVHPDPLIELDP